jgi:hypothetical protein
MNELSEIVFNVLLGAVALYVVVFWGIWLASIFRSYVHDGEKDYKSFYTSKKWLNLWLIDGYRGGACDLDVKFMGGILYPTSALFFLVVLAAITNHGGGPAILIILGFLVGLWVVLRIMRTVVRLSKRLVAHEKDSDAHK